MNAAQWISDDRYCTTCYKPKAPDHPQPKLNSQYSHKFRFIHGWPNTLSKRFCGPRRHPKARAGRTWTPIIALDDRPQLVLGGFIRIFHVQRGKIVLSTLYILYINDINNQIHIFVLEGHPTLRDSKIQEKVAERSIPSLKLSMYKPIVSGSECSRFDVYSFWWYNSFRSPIFLQV